MGITIVIGAGVALVAVSLSATHWAGRVRGALA
jgi:hypothetical protein